MHAVVCRARAPRSIVARLLFDVLWLSVPPSFFANTCVCKLALEFSDKFMHVPNVSEFDGNMLLIPIQAGWNILAREIALGPSLISLKGHLESANEHGMVFRSMFSTDPRLLNSFRRG